ncbi:MAG: RNA-binding domain-containing protein [Nitrospirales bacterium]
MHKKLKEFLSLPAETEWVEFKAARGEFDFDQLGRYFSALSNEAGLQRQAFGWLVLGVTNDHPRRICGTRYKESQDALNKLKHEIAQETNHQLTFHAIHELRVEEQRVLLFQVPASINGVPTEWRGRVYGRHGESVSPLSLSEIDRIRAPLREDWSAHVVERASLADLDPDAVQFSRVQYQGKHPQYAAEIAGWDDATFLNKAKVCIGGNVTRAALLLLGKEESTHFLSPAQSRITWVLRNEQNLEKDYQHFDLPLILAGDKVLAKIRNLNVRQLPSGTLFPHEVTQYDPWVMRETLHNCIAHQDYTLAGRINVVETTDWLLFTNLGSFIPGTVEDMIRSDAPPEIYRNPFLAQAMVNLNMIDTIGSGIKRMFMRQRDRSLPMPDYELDDPGKVVVRLTGRVLDENYTQLLMRQADLDLLDVIALDKVQKQRALDDNTFTRLKERKLIEGRRPNLFVSAKIAAVTGEKAAYIKNRAFDKAHYKDMVVAYLRQFGRASREDLNRLLLDKLSNALDHKQKRHFVTNLLQEMKREKLIQVDGATRGAFWRLYKTGENLSD